MFPATQHLVSVTEVSNNASGVIARATSGESLIILKNNKPTAALIPMADAERLGHLDEMEADLRLAAAALIRITTDNGRRHSLDEVAEEFGIDLDSSEME